MDAEFIESLIELCSSDEDIAVIQENAKKAWPPFPHNGCAANLSALFQLAGMNVPMTLGAGKLSHILQERGWYKIKIGEQNPGDVGVTFDENYIPGADHIYFVVKVFDSDKMKIADNQSNTIHLRFASGKGKTRTEYFLRAS
jgi:hypothetical protein